MASLKELLGSRANKYEAYKAIVSKKDDEKRDYTAEETSQLETLDGELDSLTSQINKLTNEEKHRSRVAELDALMAEDVERQTRSGQPGGAKEKKPHSLTLHRPKMGGRIETQNLSFAVGSKEFERSSDEYQTLFADYLRTGREHLGMQVGKDDQGGYLAPPAFMADLIKFLDNSVFMRQLCTTIAMPGVVNLGIPSWDTDPGDADWTAEVPASDISEDTSARIGKRELMPHLLTKLVKLSKKLIASSAIPMPSLLTDRLGYKFAITEEQAFLTGTGAQRPLGVFVASSNGISTSRDTTAASTTAFTADELIDTLYALKEAYQRSATWIVHRDTVKRARKLKDGNSQYLWAPGLAGGQPSTILDRPYVTSEYAPNTFTTGLYVAIVGDFSKYYIVDSMGLEVQSLAELFALKNQVGYLGRKETDGMPVLEEAFSRLKLA